MKPPVYSVMEYVCWKEIDHQVIVVNTQSGAYYSLNETASHIWCLCIAGRTPPEMVAAMAATYQVIPSTLAVDVEATIHYWLQEALVKEAN